MKYVVRARIKKFYSNQKLTQTINIKIFYELIFSNFFYKIKAIKIMANVDAATRILNKVCSDDFTNLPDNDKEALAFVVIAK